MEDVPIHKEIPFQLNEDDVLANHFTRLHTRLDSMDAQIMSYGEKIGVLSD